MANDNDKLRVGNLRPSQLIWSYGPGAMIDLPNFSVITQCLEKWNTLDSRKITENRLLEKVRKMCGSQVKYLLHPPMPEEDTFDPKDKGYYIGVPVSPFPRWFRCVKCGLLAPYDSGMFEIKECRGRPERTRFVHAGCQKGVNGRPVDAVPVRFLAACKNGHIDDFPWRWFVHGGLSECKEPLHFVEQGASLQVDNLWVTCGCGAKRSLATAYGKQGRKTMPACRGHHPHWGIGPNSYGKCEEELRPILLGASNSWFPVSLSVLSIPTKEDELAQHVADNLDMLKAIPSKEQLAQMIPVLVAMNPKLAWMTSYTPDEIWAALEKAKAPKKEATGEVTEEEIKWPEWIELTSEHPVGKFPEFMSKPSEVPDAFKGALKKVVLLERLRKVNALIGFTRIEARDDFADEKTRPVSLSRYAPEWIPASEVFGEGLFLQFDEATLDVWEKLPDVQKREKELRETYRAWRVSRNMDPEKGFPGARYYLLHTISHLFIRELALECGYNAASIQERIYATKGEHQMAGILVYTAAADSDGTLGGLVGLGAKDKLGGLLMQALVRAKTCSSDPLCSEHTSEADAQLHGAACHACSFAAETTCEVGNRYLDRSLVVTTYSHPCTPFFEKV